MSGSRPLVWLTCADATAFHTGWRVGVPGVGRCGAVADDSAPRLPHSVITSADDGQDHLVCDRAALRVYRESGRGAFPAVCGFTVRPETDVRKMGVTRCQACTQRLPVGVVVRGEPRRPIRP